MADMRWSPQVRFARRLTTREKRFLNIAASSNDATLSWYRRQLELLAVFPGPDGLYRKRDLPPHSWENIAKAGDRRAAKKLIRAFDKHIWMMVNSGYGRVAGGAVEAVPVAAMPTAAQLPLIGDDII